MYGDETYFPVGFVSICAKIRDDDESVFLPAVYQVGDVQVIDGLKVDGISEVVSYEGLYGDIADIGQTIIAKGKLERVIEAKSNKEHYRVLIGSTEGKGEEYIKTVSSEATPKT